MTMITSVKDWLKKFFASEDDEEVPVDMDMTNKIRKAGRAHGRVQGVGFRFFVQTEAKRRGVTGWVKNMDDGTVTMEIQGTPEQLDSLVERLKKGNGFAKVSQLDLDDIDTVRGELKFGVLY